MPARSPRPCPLPRAARRIGSCEVQPTPEIAGTVSDLHVDAANRERHRSCYCSDTPPPPNPLVVFALRPRWFSWLIADQASDALHLILSLAPKQEASTYPLLVMTRPRGSAWNPACGTLAAGLSYLRCTIGTGGALEEWFRSIPRDEANATGRFMQSAGVASVCLN